jgi:hypothetical protein
VSNSKTVIFRLLSFRFVSAEATASPRRRDHKSDLDWKSSPTPIHLPFSPSSPCILLSAQHPCILSSSSCPERFAKSHTSRNRIIAHLRRNRPSASRRITIVTSLESSIESLSYILRFGSLDIWDPLRSDQRVITNRNTVFVPLPSLDASRNTIVARTSLLISSTMSKSKSNKKGKKANKSKTKKVSRRNVLLSSMNL